MPENSNSKKKSENTVITDEYNTDKSDFAESGFEDDFNPAPDVSNADISFNSESDLKSEIDFDLETDNEDLNNETDWDEVFKEDTGKMKNTRKRAQLMQNTFLKRIKRPAFITIFILLVTLVVLFTYSYSLSTVSTNKAMKNVYIENIDVGGLSYDDILNTISSTHLFENTQITLVSGEHTFNINGSDIGLAALYEETAQKAVNYCRDGNFIQNACNAFMLLFKHHVIIPAPQVDTALLDMKLHEFGNMVLGERKQHYVEFGDDGMLTIYSGHTGYNENPEAAREAILNSIAKEKFSNIQVSFETAPPDDMTIESLDAMVYMDHAEAKYEINGNDVSIIPEVPGRYLNKEEAAPLLQNVYEGCEPVRIPYYVSQPEKTAAKLQEKLFETTLASYSTNYSSSTENRRANVARAAELINGTVIGPGDVFSFNDTVGKRTKENGFYTAKEYLNGQSVDGIGGGVCQVSSTLYSAVLYADMSIVERLNHMLTVGYIPLGQDATVSDSGVDFKFRNSSDYPVKISAYTNGSTITVSIIGGAWEPERSVKIKNTETSSGGNRVVHSTRYVYSGDTLISTDTLNSSTYMPPGGSQSSSQSERSTDSDDDDDDSDDDDDD
ncbi:MAG: VanW family protein [Oscillospiraceae bacterium]|nr:VanW family protein [Oscillospiraceae bacterium]